LLYLFVADIAESVIQHLRNPGMKTGITHLQEKLSQILTSTTKTSTRVSQIWSTLDLKLDFPKCTDIYVPHNFSSKSKSDDEYLRYNFHRAVDTVAQCAEKVIVITASPGMGKSRASEEIHTQLVLRMSGHLIVYVKLSSIISFWTNCENNPSVKQFLLECIDEDKLQQCSEGDNMILVMDGFDEVCPHFRLKVITLIKELLMKGTKVLITSRPQEQDKIIKGLQQETNIINFKIESFANYQKILMLQTRLNLAEDRLA
jgi:predicted NACHT family NTPase